MKLWLDVNKLALNIDKTNFVILSHLSIFALPLLVQKVTFQSERPVMSNLFFWMKISHGNIT